ncbi:hypothetical protein P879_11407 [Paragonimus westermani]|uniref:Dolichyl-diphosphooligosaccharide--protein glycosyltransferase subunit KCP2 n=1 Tax=Paragonimus westermani TaxID=34504 RepID=A0A8T0D0Y2_9TREM|nr:hypothetical protein P879_11407 [Paragonimus westermani]
MPLTTGLSCIMSSLLSVITIAGMRLGKEWICSSKQLTIFGGFLGSIIFVLLLTMTNNAENVFFGSGFQSCIFPEIFTCMFLACIISGLIHPVCGTTCVPFSLFALYCVHQLCQELYGTLRQPSAAPVQKKRN